MLERRCPCVLPRLDCDDVITMELAFHISGKVFANTRQEVVLGHEPKLYLIIDL